MIRPRPTLTDHVIIPAFVVHLWVRECAATVRDWAVLGLFPTTTVGFYTLGSLRQWIRDMSAWDFR